MATLEDLFTRLENTGLTLNLKICEFAQAEFDFLGDHVNRTGIKLLRKKVEVIAQFPRPQKQIIESHFLA